MMPLCTTDTPPTLCGWALPSDGRPCVAQRVWPMPTLPRGCSTATRRSSSASLPRRRRTCDGAPFATAIPAES